jgi:hypothetical protein
MTIRFPTMVRLRLDKPWWDCMTRYEIDQFVQSAQNGRLCHSVQVSLDKHDDEDKSKKKRLRAPAPEVHGVLSREKIAKLAPVSSIFESLRFNVRGSTQSISQTALQEVIVQNGGNIVANVTGHNSDKIDLIVVGDEDFSVKVLVDAVAAPPKEAKKKEKAQPVYDMDILKFQWVFDSVKKGHVEYLYPWMWRFITSRTRSRMKDFMCVDVGFVWSQRPTLETAALILNNVPNPSPKGSTIEHIEYCCPV